MMLIVFRSRLTEAAGSDYSARGQAIKDHAQRFPGFVDIKSLTAEIVRTSQFQRDAQTTT